MRVRQLTEKQLHERKDLSWRRLRAAVRAIEQLDAEIERRQTKFLLGLGLSPRGPDDRDELGPAVDELLR